MCSSLGGDWRGVARFGQNIPAAAPPRADPHTLHIYIYYIYICYDNATHAQLVRSQNMSVMVILFSYKSWYEHISIVKLQKKPDFVCIGIRYLLQEFLTTFGQEDLSPWWRKYKCIMCLILVFYCVTARRIIHFSVLPWRPLQTYKRHIKHTNLRFSGGFFYKYIIYQRFLFIDILLFVKHVNAPHILWSFYFIYCPVSL